MKNIKRDKGDIEGDARFLRGVKQEVVNNRISQVLNVFMHCFFFGVIGVNAWFFAVQNQNWVMFGGNLLLLCAMFTIYLLDFKRIDDAYSELRGKK